MCPPCASDVRSSVLGVVWILVFAFWTLLHGGGHKERSADTLSGTAGTRALDAAWSEDDLPLLKTSRMFFAVRAVCLGNLSVTG